MSGTRVWQNRNRTLVIQNISAEDAGPYWCVAWNEGGVTMEMTELIVVEQPIVTMSVSGTSSQLHTSTTLTTLTTYTLTTAVALTMTLHNIL